MEPIVLNWSSGKDAALAFHILQQSGSYHIRHLLTTISREHGRIIMHGVREELLDRQAAAIGLPLQKVYLDTAPDNSAYERSMEDALTVVKNEGITKAAFGDIFLEDLREYREVQLSRIGITGIFPLWKKNTRELVGTLEDAGIEAIIVCVNEQLVVRDFLGQRLTRELADRLPAGVDPCGENGEFHTFVTKAPYFRQAVAVKTGEVTRKLYNEGGDNEAAFLFLDLLPGG